MPDQEKGWTPPPPDPPEVRITTADNDARLAAERASTLDWVFNTVVPQLDAEAEDENVIRLQQPKTRNRKLRIGDVVYDVFPEADK